MKEIVELESRQMIEEQVASSVKTLVLEEHPVVV